MTVEEFLEIHPDEDVDLQVPEGRVLLDHGQVDVYKRQSLLWRMAEMNEAYLYPYSAEYARQRGEESLWRASYLSNMDCKDAIRKAVWQHYDGAHLDGDCLAKVIQEFGYKRTAWVLANTIQQLEWGGQYSSENKEWALSLIHI